MRPLETSARKLGVQILLQHSLTNIVRETGSPGRVLGITAANQGKTLSIRAAKGVIIGTGGHTSNVNFRRMFDARLTGEYQVVGEPYSRQTGDGEIAALRIGAALWGALTKLSRQQHERTFLRNRFDREPVRLPAISRRAGISRHRKPDG